MILLLKNLLYGDDFEKKVAYTRLLNLNYTKKQILQLCIDNNLIIRSKSGSKNKIVK